jgi:hypothetical protein
MTVAGPLLGAGLLLVVRALENHSLGVNRRPGAARLMQGQIDPPAEIVRLFVP